MESTVIEIEKVSARKNKSNSSRRSIESATLLASDRSDEFSILDPLGHPDWDSLVQSHPESCFFHGSSWLKVLRDTYGHRPFCVARVVEETLQDLLPIAEVHSPLTGRRGVSLPFMDFCAPLQSDARAGAALFRKAMDLGRQRRWRYLECRGGNEVWESGRRSVAYCGHTLDLRDAEAAIFARFSGACRRCIRKAERSGLRPEFGTSLESVRTFYKLHCLTRRSHGLPPQPFPFFENIQRHVLQPGAGFAVIVRLGDRPVGGALFFYNQSNALYKFGASDTAFLSCRPNNFMMWAAIKHCKEMGCHQLHFGRTSLDNQGLRHFKMGFGAQEEEIQYSTYNFKTSKFVPEKDRVNGWFNLVFANMPLSWLRLAGKVFYPHLS